MMAKETSIKTLAFEMFLKACASYGLKDADIYQVNDLYEGKNIFMVIDNLFCLGGLAQKNNWAGPTFGVRPATENKRVFDEETLNAGKMEIGLQYSSHKGASQAGMGGYGLGRQIRAEDMMKQKGDAAYAEVEAASS